MARAAAREAVANLDTPVEHPMPGAHLPPVCRTPDPGKLFARAAHAVRQAIALENRVAAGNFSAPRDPGHRSPGQPRPHPDGPHASQAGFQAEPAETLDQDCFSATGNRPDGEILTAIRQTLGLAPSTPPAARSARPNAATLPRFKPGSPPRHPPVRHGPTPQPPPRPG